MVQGEGPQGRPGGAGVGAPEAPPRAARSAALPAGLGRRLAGGGGKRGAKGPRRSRGQGDHSPSSPMNSRMREPCGMSSAPMGKKWR